MYVTPVSMMGIALPASPLLLLPNNTDAGNLAVRFRIKSGDPEGFFKADPESHSQIADIGAVGKEEGGGWH